MPGPLNPPPQQNYEPTTVPTAGQPLLRNNHILVYPIGKESCPKCHNTGYKPFVGTGGDDPNHPCRKVSKLFKQEFGNKVVVDVVLILDPFPCSQCWEKFGRPFTGAIRIAATATPTPPNYQRPLRLSYRPPTGVQFAGGVYPGAVYRQAQRPGMMQQQGMGMGMGNTYGQPNAAFNAPSRIHVTHQPPIGGGAVVLRPGDPRLGGVRCYRCGGDGTTWGIFFLEETCDLCRGVGRLY
ncbi:BQ5605_C047g12326 [Microbotryum silenes-dioicae]|uniref:BQ5605_C047g12326 protein n=1 Tax=Microbotryum silenes-dioicae TaxID=796604 RepID=A0A2X0NBG3_9BASI|nr:BQ5605_C047g12326 [Microbotryum silenes-dioicae]